MKRKPEILAPVGGREQLIAAVRCGADAVYFGLQGFNARRNAENFGGDDLKETIEYCHEHGVRVYITINTLVLDRELSDMRETVDAACAAGADGLIVQDMAVVSYCKYKWPNVPLIASTQMAVHNAEGVNLLKSMGFNRAVMARELTLAEIKDIYEKTGMEIEVFVHGAHCMSVSGACYLSSMIGGRSGNRGLCAQPCRLDCSVCGRDHALSLKDLSYIEHISELSDAGVCSLKIEGRMKRAEYVAAAVTACKDAIAGRKPDMETLKAVFSRSGFTDGYLKGNRNLDMFGYRTKEDVTAAADVLGSLAKLYEKESQDIPVDMLLYVNAGENSQLSVSDGTCSVTVLGEIPQLAKTMPISEEYARRSLSKTGGTPYYLRGFTLCAQEGLMLASSQLNELRRNALAQLKKERIDAFCNKEKSLPLGTEKESAVVSSDVLAPGNAAEAAPTSGLAVRFESTSQIFKGCPKTVILPLSELAKKGKSSLDKARGCGAERIYAEIPPVFWPSHADAVRKQLDEIKALGICDVYAENLGGLAIAREKGFAVHGGMLLNILNSRSLDVHLGLGLSDACVSFETAFSDMKKLLGKADCSKLGAVIYGYLPLMKFRACPAKGALGCGNCSGKNTLVDRLGEEFTIICREKQYSELLNCVPLYVGDRKLPKLGFELMYFTTESAEECKRINDMVLKGDSLPGRRTAGLYFRDLQ